MVETYTRQDIAAYMQQVEQEEATWEKYKIFNYLMAVLPNGQCYIYDFCKTHNNVRDALMAIAAEQICIFQSWINSFQSILGQFDTGERTYSNYFSERYVNDIRLRMPLSIKYLQLYNEGRFPLCCSNCGYKLWDLLDNINDLTNMPNVYCPNCEAKITTKFEIYESEDEEE